MRLVKNILVALLLLFILIQFARPHRNTHSGPLPNDISTHISMPDSARLLLQVACYDCHSNNTRYPWYMNIQPMGWLMAKHVREGKEELNFSQFGDYSKRRQVSKLKAIASSVKDGTMPLASYTWMHRDAKLSKQSKTLIINWATKAKDSLELQN